MDFDSRPWIHLPMKTDKIGLVQFCWFTENRPVEFDFFKILNKNPKK
jgi:hypothetical protein